MLVKHVSFWLAVVLALLLAAAAAWFWFGRPVAVEIVSPRRGEAVELVYATGFVEPVQPVSVASRITAPVSAVLVEEDQPVRRGQALLRLDDADLRGAFAQAHAQSVGATLTERRTATLFRQGWVTRAALDAAVANGEAARAATDAAEARLGQNVIRAGIDGVVIKRDVEPGDLATPSRVLLLLGDPRRMRVTATVDERDIPRVRTGQKALLSSDAWPGRVVTGRVASMTPTGDPDQRAFRVRLSIDGGAALPMGMTLEVNIVSRSASHALLVPVSALTGATLWVVEDGRARRRPVRTGIVGSERAQVEAGLSDNDRVIDHPSATLREGMRVRPAGA